MPPVHAIPLVAAMALAAPQVPQGIPDPLARPGQRPDQAPVQDDRSTLTIAPDGVIGIVGPRDLLPGPEASAGFVVDVPCRALGEPAPTLFLDDGQRIVGRLVMGPSGIRWKHPSMPPFAIDPSRTRFLVMSGPIPPRAEAADAIHLFNGDRIEGIVETVDAAGVSLSVAGADGAAVTTVPIDAVRAIAFVVPDRPRAGMRAWLTDGSVIDGSSIRWIGRGEAAIEDVASLPGEPVRILRSDLAAAEFRPGSIRPLARLMRGAAPPSGDPVGRHATVAPRLGAGTWAFDAPTITLEGPVRVECDPPGAPSRLVATVRRSPTAAHAGSVVVRVESGGNEAFRARLGVGQRECELRADLAASGFAIELLSDDGSLVGDCVELERAVVVSAPTQP